MSTLIESEIDLIQVVVGDFECTSTYPHECTHEARWCVYGPPECNFARDGSTGAMWCNARHKLWLVNQEQGHICICGRIDLTHWIVVPL